MTQEGGLKVAAVPAARVMVGLRINVEVECGGRVVEVQVAQTEVTELQTNMDDLH